MNDDVIRLVSAVLARLTRLGGGVARASAVARVPSNGVVSTEQFFAFWAALGDSSPSDIGLRLATETQVHEYDVSSLAALHSPDVRTALAKVARYKRLCGPKDMVVEARAGEVTVHTTYVHAPGPPPARLVDASLASLLVLVQRGSGLQVAPKRLELTRARSDEPMLMRFFGCPLRFRARRDALVLDERLLTTPFVTHNADLLQVLVPSLDQKLGTIDQGAFVEKVRAAVARRMSGERPHIAKVARDLSLSTRSLQRRLGDLGVSYGQVLDGVRHHAALRLLLADDVAITEIAFLLGFEELNSFTRAFRGWEGKTPTRWRDSMSERRDPI